MRERKGVIPKKKDKEIASIISHQIGRADQVQRWSLWNALWNACGTLYHERETQLLLQCKARRLLEVGTIRRRFTIRFVSQCRSEFALQLHLRPFNRTRFSDVDASFLDDDETQLDSSQAAAHSSVNATQSNSKVQTERRLDKFL